MDIETAFDLSSHEHRRAIVAILDETSPISRNRLTERVADRLDDSQSGPTRVHSARTTRCRIRIALRHNHLPRLAEAGVVEYDDETVSATSQLDALVDRLEAPSQTREPVSPDLKVLLTEFYS